MIKKLYLILILIIPLTIQNVYADDNVYYKNEETNYEVIYEDRAGLLTEKEKEQLISDMKPLTKYGYIGFITIDDNSGSTESFARDYYHDNFDSKSGTILLIDMDNRIVYIFSDGSNNKLIDTRKALIITDNVYKYAKNEKYYECAKEAYREIYTVLRGGKIIEPMRHSSNYIMALVTSAFITFFIAYETTKMKGPKVEKLIEKCDHSFDLEVLNAVKTGQRKVYSPRSRSSSSGGSSGGGSSGGGSSGSGGGHSF